MLLLSWGIIRMYWCWSLLRYWAVCSRRLRWRLSKTGSEGRFRDEMVWFNRKIGSFDTLKGWFGWVCWVGCWGMFDVKEEVGWVCCWDGRFDGGVWNGLLWVLVWVRCWVPCWLFCWGGWGGSLIPKLPKMPPKPWFKSPMLLKVIVVAWGFPKPIPLRRFPKGFGKGGGGGTWLELFCPFWFWVEDCCWFEGWVVLVVLAEVVYCPPILAIRCTVIPDYFTKNKKVLTIFTDLVIIYKLLTSKDYSLPFEGNVNLFQNLLQLRYFCLLSLWNWLTSGLITNSKTSLVRSFTLTMNWSVGWVGCYTSI